MYLKNKLYLIKKKRDIPKILYLVNFVIAHRKKERREENKTEEKIDYIHKQTQTHTHTLQKNLT